MLRLLLATLLKWQEAIFQDRLSRSCIYAKDFSGSTKYESNGMRVIHVHRS